MINVRNKMRIFDASGSRLYLNGREREKFIESSNEESREGMMFCRILHDTGCRPTEALNLMYKNIFIEEKAIQFRSLKKRKYDKEGNLKEPKYRVVPVHDNLISDLSLSFNLIKKMKNQKNHTLKLFSISRSTAYRLVVRVMKRAGIKGKMVNPKGLRHGFAIALLVGEKPAPIHIVSKMLGHSDIETTLIYLDAVGNEQRKLVMQALYL